MNAALHGDLGTILEWTQNDHKKQPANPPAPEMSVSVVAGARNQRCLHLDEVWL